MSGWLFNRPSQPKRSVISRTEESQLKRSQRAAEELLQCSQKLQKDAKKCTDALAAASKTEIKLAENLATGSLCSTEEDFGHKVDLWVQRLHRQENVLQELSSNINKTIVEPMRKFSSINPSLQNALKERDKCVQELNRCQAKVEKYQERDRTGPNIVKLDTSRKQLATAKEEYDVVNQPVQQDLPELYAARVDYMEPCLKALVWSQARYFRETHNCYDDVYNSMNSDQNFLLDDNYDKRLQARIDEIRALSIVVE